MCEASSFGAHMIQVHSSDLIAISITLKQRLADVQSSQSRIAIRESCTGICDVIPVVNDILRILQDTVLLSNYSFHVSVGAHSGSTINFFNVRRIRLRELSSAFFGGMWACGNCRQYARESFQLQPIFIQDTRA